MAIVVPVIFLVAVVVLFEGPALYYLTIMYQLFGRGRALLFQLLKFPGVLVVVYFFVGKPVSKVIAYSHKYLAKVVHLLFILWISNLLQAQLVQNIICKPPFVRNVLQ